MGDGLLWKAVVARVYLRRRFGKKPSAEEVENFIEARTTPQLEELAMDLEGHVNRAFRKGEEVCVLYHPRRGLKLTLRGSSADRSLGDEVRQVRP